MLQDKLCMLRESDYFFINFFLNHLIFFVHIRIKSFDRICGTNDWQIYVYREKKCNNYCLVRLSNLSDMLESFNKYSKFSFAPKFSSLLPKLSCALKFHSVP